MKKAKSHAINLHPDEEEEDESDSVEDEYDLNEFTNEGESEPNESEDAILTPINMEKTKSNREKFGENKIENMLSIDLFKEGVNPKENIQNLCQFILEISRSLDIEIQKKISGEVNQGKVAINAKKHIRDEKIKDQTLAKKKPDKLYHKITINEDDDLPEDREFIDFGHEKFDLVFNIMLGIKRSIDCLFESPFSKLRAYDYKAKYQYKNEWYSASETSAHVFIFYDYAPKIFEDIRIKDGISNDSYIEALGPNNIYNYIWTNDFKSFTALISSGKSGSLFYYSMDGRFMLKTISKDEFIKLRATLQPYHEHLLRNPDSLMTRYYGLHRIKYSEGGKSKEQYIIIMNNMFRKFSPDIKYDLKGSVQGRHTEYKDIKIDYKIAMKDNDFIDQNRTVEMTDEDKESLLKIIQKDSEYLGENLTLDYSLLLGIIDLEKIKEDYQNDPDSFHEKDPVLQILKDDKSDIEERGIYVSENQKEVSFTLFANTHL